MASASRRLLLVTCAFFALAIGGASGWALARYQTPLPAPGLDVALPQSPAAGIPVPVALPDRGGFALVDDHQGVLASRDFDVARPTASIAKTMTALAVLAVHPLAAGAPGPTFTVTAADVAVLRQVIQEDGSHVDVSVGEQLSERDLLLGLMLPSADNFAVMLGRWVDGTDAAFVARLNSMARAWKLSATHFADADGLSDATVSSPRDLAVLGQKALANPVLAEIMQHPQATLSNGAVVDNIDTLVGVAPGWLGIKTGHTNAAGYCLLFAARRDVVAGDASTAVTAVGVVLGQSTRNATLSAATAAVDSDLAGYSAINVTQPPHVHATLRAAWGATSAMTAVAAGTSPFAVIRKGDGVSLHVSGRPISATPAAGTVAGQIQAVDGSRTVAVWNLKTSSALAPPPWWWRLTRYSVAASPPRP